ncbi:MAG: HAMP domain-containing sensor histidine kinase, partial [Candidatus Riflebacteria bacterium]|nr:HAMP domain-containing sensor histidine kinase [Candidatus Riflebacteria bacterium]
PLNPFRRLIPATLAARLFWGIFAASLISAVAIWSWLYSRFYDSLDFEASLRLKQIGSALLSEAGSLNQSQNLELSRRSLVKHIWQLEKSAGLIQNLYWVDLAGERPLFIASFTQATAQGPVLVPPSADEAEDLIYDHINALERGEMVFPDPYAYGAGRRLKIILCPLLDANGMLSSVFGIEADMEYLRLAGEFRSILAEGITLAIFISLLVALLLAENLSAKIAALGHNLTLLAKGQKPASLNLAIKEFDELYQAFVKMAADLEQQRATVRQVFVRKLEELSFTGGAIAHEIRNPLSAIEMHFGLLKRNIARQHEPGSLSGPVEEIDQQLQHLRKLLTSFLDYSRRVQPQPETVNLADFFSRVIGQRRLVLGNFDFDLQIEAGLCGTFDPVMLQQVIENLVNNSFRATGGAGLELCVQAGVSERLLRIEISDNGPGVPSALQKQLFTPFMTGNADGSGFGLALSRKLIEAQGGEIFYKEVPDRGAVFAIEVPQNENSGC